jgi:DNA adenine methylase
MISPIQQSEVDWTGYPGSKGASGVAERTVSIIPAHRVWVSGFLGQCAVTRLKLPGDVDLGFDRDPDIVARWQDSGPAHVRVILGNSIQWLDTHRGKIDRTWTVYLDPPYILDSRTSKKRLYRFEMRSVERHREMLGQVVDLPCNLMICHYAHPLYLELLAGWHIERMISSTRGGPREELVFCNFDPAAVERHDVRFLGNNYRERERIKRKKQRWARRLAAMPAGERQAVREALEEIERVQ